MTDPDTPRPSADEIRGLVAQVREDWPFRATRIIDEMEPLLAAVESLLEDRELLDGLERALAERPPAKVYVGLTVSGYETLVTYGPKGRVSRGDTIRAALKQAVGG